MSENSNSLKTNLYCYRHNYTDHVFIILYCVLYIFVIGITLGIEMALWEWWLFFLIISLLVLAGCFKNITMLY